MLEPSNVSRLTRRRRLHRIASEASRRDPKFEPSASRMPKPSPVRSPVSPAALPSDRPRLRPEPAAIRLERSRRAARASSPTSPRFNLRHLLFGTTLATALPLQPNQDREMLQRSNTNLRSVNPRLPRSTPTLRVAAPGVRTPRLEPPRPKEPPSADRVRPLHQGFARAAQMPPVRQRRRRPPSLMLHVTRLVILGVGIGAIAGTMLAILNPTARQGEMAETTRSLLSGSQPVTTASGTATALNPQPIRPIALQMGEPMTELASRIQALTAQYDGLTPGVFLMDMDTGAYLDLNGTSIFATASMVKVPILVAFLQDVDAGKIQLDEPLTMKPEDIAEGSGEMQYEPAGTQFTALETASEMITISDNTATNMIIARLGGAAALNQRFREWGLTNTMIRNLLPDLEGTNTTTPKELTELMARVSQGDLLSLRSRDRLFEIMRQTVTNTLLPAGLAPEATVAHKTGDIGSLVGDVGMIDAPNGKRYVITVMVQRPHNDDRAQELIRQISRETYAYLTQPIAATLEPAAE